MRTRRMQEVVFMLFRPVAALAAALSIAAGAQEAGPAFDAPIKAASLLDAQIHALPQEDVALYADRLSVTQTYSVFAGQNDALAAGALASAGKRLHIGENFAAGLAASDIFADRWEENGVYVFMGAVTSVDALGLRLKLDLSGLNQYDEVYILDLTLPRAHGPWTRDDALDGGWWTASVEGDTAAVMVRSAHSETPQLQVVEVAHYFLDPVSLLKQASCNNPIACETNATIQQISSAVGRYAFSSGFSSFVCSGSLLNNPNTQTLEPYFLTANHCISSQAEVNSMEVFWDYRIDVCAGGVAPSLNSLLRSEGDQLLGTSGVYDGTLIRLDSVSPGAFGRAYLGWTLTAPTVGADMLGIHHPGGSHMRISFGDVTVPEENAAGFQDQIRVEWFDGVTEGGSSGSPLMFRSGDFRVFGMLSNGAVHVCPENAQLNYDYYASFARFFPSISAYLTGSSAPPALDDGEPVDPGVTTCPANLTLKDYPALLDSLRGLRDSGLLETPLGQAIVSEYYKAAPGFAEIVGESDAAKGLFLLGAGPASQLNEPSAAE